MSDYNIPVSGGVNGLNVPLHGHIAVYNKEFPVIPNPEGEVTGYVTKLGFTPEILQVKDPEVHDWARAEEKPTYTKAEVGLGNVDNTSDLNKPISTATQTALDGKVDKVPGKALSTNDYTDTDKAIVDGVTSALATKVDKIAGKGLSSNDYTDYEKTKLAYIQSGAEVNVQADWFESNRWSDAFILNKPTKLSDFSNDTGFITSTVDNLTYYYKKSETYTQAEVNALIGSIVTISFLVVQTLPQTGEANIIYLVPADEPNPDNIYEEYIYVNNNWEMIGTTKVDLSNYYTKTETDNLLSAKADSSSVYTKTETETALGNKVDKVSGKGLSTNDYDDTAKGIVDGVTSALDGKVDKDGDKVLSDNNYSDTDKSIVGGVTSALADKVDKAEGYGLSENDYTDEEKAKVGEIDNKLDKTENAIRSDALAIISPVNDNALYIYRQTPVKESFKALMKKIVGASIVWNQLVDSNTTSVTIASGHRYIAKINGTLTFGTSDGTAITVSANDYFTDLTAMFGTTIADYVYTLETSQSGSGIAWLQSYGFFTEDYYAYKQNKLESGCVSAHKTYDGETLLTNTELSPITLRGLFKLSTDKLTVDGDEYNADGSVTRKYGIVDMGSIEWGYNSTNAFFYGVVNGIKYKTSNILASGYSTIITKLPSQMADVDNMSICTRNYDGEQVQIKNSSYTDAQIFTNAMRGVYMIFELATPTTEQTTPFTETEIVGSTEEFIDYGVAQNTRDVAIPVGTDTDYYQEMKLPSLPTTSGNHNLIYNIATGFGWS